MSVVASTLSLPSAPSESWRSAANPVVTSESPASSPMTPTVAYWSQFNPPGSNIVTNWIGRVAAQLPSAISLERRGTDARSRCTSTPSLGLGQR